MSQTMYEKPFRPHAVNVAAGARPQPLLAADCSPVEAGPLCRDPEMEGKLVTDDRVAGAHREQYRRLAASLHQLHPEGLSIVMVASAMPAEGKTLTAVNLALTFSQSYQRDVLLIDADLRRPRLHAMFGVPDGDGLSQHLAGANEPVLRVRPIAPQLSLLSAGAATADPMARLTSARMKRVFTQAADSFDWVIVDTPALAILPDAELLASMVDGVLLVIRARSTPYESVKRAVDALGRARIVGIVLNQVDPALLQPHAGEYDRYYSQERAGE